MADFSLPTVSDLWSNIIAFLKNRDLDITKGLDPATTTVTNPVADMLRWNSAAGYWEKYNGSAWGLQASTYNINVSTLGGAAASTYAPKASPTFTGTPAAPTAGAGTNTTQLATCQFVTTALGFKADLASPTFTGTPAAPTPTGGDNTTKIATTAFVQGAIAPKANTASPTFTGTPTAPTPSTADNSTTLSTTAYVINRIANDAPTKTGGGASGTWGINISGNAATVTNGVYNNGGSYGINVTGSAGNTQTFMSTSHAGSYWLVNNWDGARWSVTSNHGAAVRVGYADSAGNGGVTSVNGSTGAVSGLANAGSNIGTGAHVLFAGFSGNTMQFKTLTSGSFIDINSTADTITINYSTGGGGDSIHPDSLLEMADGSTKWLKDVRLGDKVRGRNGAAEVLGVWINLLGDRPIVEVNGSVLCTPGHLFPTKDGKWAAPNPEQYMERSYKKKRVVKGKRGAIVTCCEIANSDTLVKLEPGVEILNADGKWVKVESVKEFTCDTKSEDAFITPSQQVMALLLKGSDVFYVDGLAVSTLA